jgi:nitronate monooxygenase
MNPFTQSIGIQFPIIQAPMAGGIDTPALVAEVGNAGALGSIGAAYLSAAQIGDAVAAVRQRTSAPFAINLFVGGRQNTPDGDAIARVQALLRPFRAELGLGPGEDVASAASSDSLDAQFEAVLRAQPRVFSFTFGVPSAEHLRALRARSIFIIGTATSLAEGEALDELGVDAICAQGSEAGAHRGTFLGSFEDAQIGTMALVPQLVRRVRRPVIAAGGIMDGRAISAALGLGAQGVQLGTAFLACPEAGTSPAHREALFSPAARRTVVTRAFSGRPARGIRNRFTDAFEGIQVPPFPLRQSLTCDIRAAASAQGRTDIMQLWAGQGAPLIRAMPAAELVRTLVREAQLSS